MPICMQVHLLLLFFKNFGNDKKCLSGGFVKLSGKIFSDRYGSNLEASTNGRKEKLLRTYVGPQDCALKDGDDL